MEMQVHNVLNWFFSLNVDVHTPTNQGDHNIDHYVEPNEEREGERERERPIPWAGANEGRSTLIIATTSYVN